MDYRLWMCYVNGHGPQRLQEHREGTWFGDGTSCRIRRLLGFMHPESRFLGGRI